MARFIPAIVGAIIGLQLGVVGALAGLIFGFLVGSLYSTEQQVSDADVEFFEDLFGGDDRE